MCFFNAQLQHFGEHAILALANTVKEIVTMMPNATLDCCATNAMGTRLSLDALWAGRLGGTTAMTQIEVAT